MISFRITNILFIYIIYNNIFRSYLNLNYHIKHNHQSLVKIKFQNDNMIKVKRMKDNIFKYKYKKNFKFSNSLYKYMKRYNDKLTKLKEDEKEKKVLMNILKDFDILKSI